MDDIYSKTIDELDQEFLAGGKLDLASVTSYLERIKINPDDFDSRLYLIGFYSANFTDFHRDFFEQLLWFVQHCPDAPYLATNEYFRVRRVPNTKYEDLMDSLKNHVESHPNRVNVLVNAAHLCLLADFKFSRACAEQAKALSPDDKRVLAVLRELDNFETAIKKTGLPELPF